MYQKPCWIKNGRCLGLTEKGDQCSYSQNCIFHRCGDPNCNENEGKYHTAHDVRRIDDQAFPGDGSSTRYSSNQNNLAASRGCQSTNPTPRARSSRSTNQNQSIGLRDSRVSHSANPSSPARRSRSDNHDAIAGHRRSSSRDSSNISPRTEIPTRRSQYPSVSQLNVDGRSEIGDRRQTHRNHINEQGSHSDPIETAPRDEDRNEIRDRRRSSANHTDEYESEIEVRRPHSSQRHATQFESEGNEYHNDSRHQDPVNGYVPTNHTATVNRREPARLSNSIVRYPRIPARSRSVRFTETLDRSSVQLRQPNRLERRETVNGSNLTVDTGSNHGLDLPRRQPPPVITEMSAYGPHNRRRGGVSQGHDPTSSQLQFRATSFRDPDRLSLHVHPPFTIQNFQTIMLNTRPPAARYSNFSDPFHLNAEDRELPVSISQNRQRPGRSRGNVLSSSHSQDSATSAVHPVRQSSDTNQPAIAYPVQTAPPERQAFPPPYNRLDSPPLNIEGRGDPALIVRDMRRAGPSRGRNVISSQSSVHATSSIDPAGQSFDINRLSPLLQDRAISPSDWYRLPFYHNIPATLDADGEVSHPLLAPHPDLPHLNEEEADIVRHVCEKHTDWNAAVDDLLDLCVSQVSTASSPESTPNSKKLKFLAMVALLYQSMKGTRLPATMLGLIEDANQERHGDGNAN